MCASWVRMCIDSGVRMGVCKKPRTWTYPYNRPTSRIIPTKTPPSSLTVYPSALIAGFASIRMSFVCGSYVVWVSLCHPSIFILFNASLDIYHSSPGPLIRLPSLLKIPDSDFFPSPMLQENSDRPTARYRSKSALYILAASPDIIPRRTIDVIFLSHLGRG